ncbi:MAG: hypothetical protein ABF915_04245, partial [Schleiferilactobacillus harbinensis]
TILGVVSVTIIVNMLMNTLWVRFMYQTPWPLLISWRLLKQFISAPIQIVILYSVLKVLVRVPGTAQLQSK